MEVFSIEIYSMVILLILLIDYCIRFKHSFNENTYIWFIIAFSVFIASFFNILINIVPVFSDDVKIILLLVSYVFTFIPMLGIFYYIKKNFFHANYLIRSKFTTIFIISLCYFLFLMFIYVSGYFSVIPSHLTSSFQHSRFLLITTIPSFILLLEAIYKKVTTKFKINFRIILILLITIAGVIIDVLCSSVTFITASYTLAVLILYICKFDKVMHIDPLTGLFNRAYLNKVSFKRTDDNDKVLYMIDVDQFKAINDNYGHLIGDKVLNDIGGLLKKSVREEDVVIRYGGDEFLIVAAVKQFKDIDKIISKINKALDNYNNINDVKVSLSIGAEPISGREIEEIIKISDKKIYQDKNDKKLL